MSITANLTPIKLSYQLRYIYAEFHDERGTKYQIDIGLYQSSAENYILENVTYNTLHFIGYGAIRVSEIVLSEVQELIKFNTIA